MDNKKIASDLVKIAKELLAGKSTSLQFVYFHKQRDFELIANVYLSYADSMKTIHKYMNDLENTVKKASRDISPYVKSIKPQMNWMWKGRSFVCAWYVKTDDISEEDIQEIGKILLKHGFKGG